eukprot:GEMP01014961.1.p1 GENE.GEMP01014961.1~~GEMP01014961.1.p1  ORF type:complete len:515 (+),score=112.99 GEMP01014961.1:96-1640(+)
MGSCLRKSDASQPEVNSWAQKTDRALQLSSATGSSAEVSTAANTLESVVPSSKAPQNDINNVVADHGTMMLQVVDVEDNGEEQTLRTEDVPDNSGEKTSISSVSTISWGLEDDEPEPGRARQSVDKELDGELTALAAPSGVSDPDSNGPPEPPRSPVLPHKHGPAAMPLAGDSATGVGGEISAGADAHPLNLHEDSAHREDHNEQQVGSGVPGPIPDVKDHAASPSDASRKIVHNHPAAIIEVANVSPATGAKKHSVSVLKRRSSLADMGQMALMAVKNLQRRRSLQDIGAALSNFTVPGLSFPKGARSPHKPCDKKFNVFFFKHPTASMSERGYMPSPNPEESVAEVNFKRLLYESHTVWYTLFFFRNMYWVGMRPKPTLQDTERKRNIMDADARRAAVDKSFSWETVARRFIFSRASKILEKNPTAPLECICTTVTSELWGARGIPSSHPLVTNTALVVSLDGDSTYFKPDDIPWVKDIPHMMDVSRPVVKQIESTSRQKDVRPAETRRTST